MAEELLKDSKTTIEEYISAMKREINPSESYVRVTRGILDRLGNIMTVTQEDIADFLGRLRKSDSEDPLHKWVGTYNFYLTILKRFFKWVNNSYCMQGFKTLKRKEISIYTPTDLWTQEDDKLFLKYCPSKRDACYHTIARDSSCRPSEIMRVKIKDVVFKLSASGNKQYAEILVNGKTGSKHIPLFNSIPYIKDWLDEHPSRSNPNSYLIRSHKTRDKMTSKGINAAYSRYRREYFPHLLKGDLPLKDKSAIRELLKKPWNPYIRRHSALTDKSKILKEHVLRQHAGWSRSSKMPERYIHYYGNESNEAILEAYGYKEKDEEINKLQPVKCPNCSEPNKIDSKFCSKCRMILSYDAYEETVNEQVKKVVDVTQLERLAAKVAAIEAKIN